MVKIKQKKTMNLPQLIEWAWDNDIKNEIFIADKQLTNIEFDDTGDVLIYGNDNKKTVKFSIEVEEEITEDTVIPKLLTTFETINVKNKVRYQRVRIDENYSIKLMLNIAEAHGEPIETLHIVNDDGTHKLIWRDGKLVE
ncbi:hypothetical protein NGB25_00155 [Staphylococcus saprophyticus]|uniref:hypothetical protein n=1 Tax=Staphylococcus saprophyticus TaxID=29385 RepID=UPI002DBCAEC0|nr:hypothetical protein [Staphylococcus saprophyticus]MEB7675569.1 hypothetical protein [Staphylococcus saprophyticus]